MADNIFPDRSNDKHDIKYVQALILPADVVATVHANSSTPEGRPTEIVIEDTEPSYALDDLSNLANVSINESLTPQAAKDLGSATMPWREAYIYGSGTYGVTSIKLTGNPSANRVVTFPDASITVARTDAAQTFTGNQTFATIPHAAAPTDKILVSDAGVLSYRTAAELAAELGSGGSYIEDQFASAQTANFWITGNARIDNELLIGLSDQGSYKLQVAGSTYQEGDSNYRYSVYYNHLRLTYDSVNNVYAFQAHKDWESYNRGVIEFIPYSVPTPLLSLGFNSVLNASGNVQMQVDGTTYLNVSSGFIMSQNAKMLIGHYLASGDIIEAQSSSNAQFRARYSETIYSNWKTTSTGKVEFNSTGGASPSFEFGQDVSVPDDAYDATSWNGNLEVPTKNAIRNKIESLGTGGISFGSDNEIPFMNSGGTDFEYSSNFYYNGTHLGLLGSGGSFAVLTPAILDIQGTGSANISINAQTGIISYSNTGNSGIAFTGAFANNYLYIGQYGGVVFNEVGLDSDFRIEGDTEQNLFFVDASTDRIGIGTNSPTHLVTLKGGGFTMIDASSAIDATLTFTVPYYGRLNYAVTPNNGHSEVRYVSKGATGGAGQTYFVVASTEGGDTGNNLLMGVSSDRVFITNAVDYSTPGSVHIGSDSWVNQGTVIIGGSVPGGTGFLTLNGYFEIIEQSAPTTPLSGFGRIYAKSDGLLYWKNDAGTEFDLTTTSGSGSNLATANQTATGDRTHDWDSHDLLITNAVLIRFESVVYEFTTGATGLFINTSTNDVSLSSNSVNQISFGSFGGQIDVGAGDTFTFNLNATAELKLTNVDNQGTTSTRVLVYEDTSNHVQFRTVAELATDMGVMTNPMTTLGDVIYGGASGAPTRLAGNTTNNPYVLKSVGSGGSATAPVWAHLASTDLYDVESGTYTPTLTNTANISSSTAFVWQYQRVGSSITVSGKIIIDPTTTSTDTELRFTLPVATDITDEQELSGCAFSPTIAGMGAAILGHVSTNLGTLKFISTDIGSNVFTVVFMYKLTPP